jgi:hypothetical protein
MDICWFEYLIQKLRSKLLNQVFETATVVPMIVPWHFLMLAHTETAMSLLYDEKVVFTMSSQTILNSNILNLVLNLVCPITNQPWHGHFPNRDTFKSGTR